MTVVIRRINSIANAVLGCFVGLATVPEAGAAPAVPETAPPAPSALVHITPVTRNNSASKTMLLLAENGKALLPIIVSATATDATKAIATEFAAYLQRISGANFQIKTGDGSEGIVLGTLADFPTSALDKALQVFEAGDGNEAFAIRTREKRLLMLAATPKGVPCAVFRLLNELGYRHFFSHPAWEVLPHREKLSFNRDITDRPSLLARQMSLAGLAGVGGVPWEQYVAWQRHNLQGSSFVASTGHNMQAIIDANKLAFEAHPEYYALVKQPDGSFKREPPMIELGNPTVRKMVTDYALTYFDENPTADMVSLEPADTLEGSYSPEAKKLGSNSDQVFGMANEVAKVLQKKRSGKMVGVLSYNTHWEPPTFSLEPNVHVMLSDLGKQQSPMSHEDRNALWSRRSRNLGFYQYFSVFAWNSDLLPSAWFNDIHAVRDEIRREVDMGGVSLLGEASPAWGLSGRSYYIAAKLMWNPDTDVDATAQDFYDKAFGAGAPAMKRYYEALDTRNHPIVSGHLMGQLYQDIQEAGEKTAGDAPVQARLDQLKLFLRYQQFQFMRTNESPTPERNTELWVAMMKSLSRGRAYSMNSWGMIRNIWGETPTPGFEKTSWEVQTPYTHDEIEREFQDGLAYFVPKIRKVIPFVNFSDDLVPVIWPAPVAPSLESLHNYYGAHTYYLYSLHGEPLEFLTYASTAWGGINDYTVKDAAGKIIARREKLPGAATTVSKIPVPKAGLYTLDYNDNGSYWTITMAPGKVATIPLISKDGGMRGGGNPFPYPMDMYFYVPKGTRAIQYFYTKTQSHTGGPHRVIRPDGAAAEAFVGGKPLLTKDFLGNLIIDVNGDFVDIPVPEGMDGKLWAFRAPVFGFFKLYNVPNYFAASPDALLVPRELAAKDGLVVRK